MKKYYWLIFLLGSFNTVLAQSNIGLKFFGLSIHPRGEKENAFLMPRKLDAAAVFVLNLGGMASYEQFIYKDVLSIKAVQALYSDCAARLGGFSHIGLRAKMLQHKKHTVYGGIGPTLVYRRNWQELDGYENQNRFKGNKENAFQYLFLWYGGEFEYAFQLSEKWDFTATFIPGYPDLMSLSFGVKYKWPARARKAKAISTAATTVKGI